MSSHTPHFKPFSPELYNLHDRRGKNRVATYLRKWNRYEVIEGEKYDVDLICYIRGNLVAYVEVEERNWGGRCPWDSIHVPYRKSKFTKPDAPTYLFAIDSNGEWGYYCEMTTILASPLIEVPNRYLYSREKFYDVPIDCFNEIKLGESLVRRK